MWGTNKNGDKKWEAKYSELHFVTYKVADAAAQTTYITEMAQIVSSFTADELRITQFDVVSCVLSINENKNRNNSFHNKKPHL